MMTKFLAISVGIAMLSGAGTAQAADVVQTNTQSKAAPAPVLVDVQTSKVVDLKNHGPLALTDDQMDGVTAGHIGNGGSLTWHWGFFNYGSAPDVWVSVYGWHQG